MTLSPNAVRKLFAAATTRFFCTGGGGLPQGCLAQFSEVLNREQMLAIGY